MNEFQPDTTLRIFEQFNKTNASGIAYDLWNRINRDGLTNKDDLLDLMEELLECINRA